jgi:hypothetical protein
LSNFQIIEKCDELKIQNFKGVCMRDELNKTAQWCDECMVINIDHSSNEGTHWTCLFIRKGVAHYFDPYGFAPTLEVKEYCKGLLSEYNTFPIQKMNEVICGHYCIYVLYKLSNGHKFYDICDELYRRSNPE